MRKYDNCPMNLPIILNMTTPSSNINKLDVEGHIYVMHDIVGDVELVVETNKCSVDMQKCDKYSTIIVRDMCKKFQEQNAFYSDVFRSIHPPFRCPIKKGNYTVSNSTFEMSRIAMLPLDGYVWVISFKWVSSINGEKPKKVILCLNSETKISKIRIAS